MVRDSDWVILMNKMIVTFLAVLTVGMLGLGTAVSAETSVNWINDSGIMIGPNVVPVNIGVAGVKVTNGWTQNGLQLIQGQRLDLHVDWERVPDVPVDINEFRITLEVSQDGVIWTPINGWNNRMFATSGSGDWSFTQTGHYRMITKGVRGATDYTIIANLMIPP